MKKVLLCLLPLLFLFTSSSIEQDTYKKEVTFTWTPPTQRVDGSSLDPSLEIASYKLYCGSNSKAYSSTYVAQGGTNSTTEQLFGEGEWFCAATAIDTNSLESALSNEVSFTVTPPSPTPPSLSVNSQEVVYALQISDRSIALIPVGKTSSTASCDVSQHVTDRNGITAYIIKTTAITWSSVTRTTAPFAKCQ